MGTWRRRGLGAGLLLHALLASHARPRQSPFHLTNPLAHLPLSPSLQRMADPNPPSPVAASQAEGADEELLLQVLQGLQVKQ